MEKSSFFDSMNVDGAWDRPWRATDFAGFFASFIGNGVFPTPSTNLQIIANDNMTITVKAGKGWIDGYHYENTDDLILNLDVADGVLDRIDTVVLQWRGLIDDGRKIVVKVKKGTFASEPVAELLQRDSDIYELKLANININHGAIKITNADITDTRLDNTVCGIVHGTVDQIDTTTLYNQYKSWYEQTTGKAMEDLEVFKAQFETDVATLFEQYQIWYEQTTGKAVEDIETFKTQFEADLLSWFDGLKNVLDENAATNLLNLINDLEADKADKSTLQPHTLLAINWQGDKPPFTYKLKDEKVTATSNQELLPSETITSKELSALQSANLTDAGQSDGYFLLQANGAKPKIDIPIRLIFRGDM